MSTLQSTLTLESATFRKPPPDGEVLAGAKARLGELSDELATGNPTTAPALRRERRELLATIRREREAWLRNRLQQAITVRDMAAQIVMVTTAELEHLSRMPHRTQAYSLGLSASKRYWASALTASQPASLTK